MDINFFILEDTKMDKKIATFLATLALIMIMATTANAWIETFETDPADLTWGWYSVRDVAAQGYPPSPTFDAVRSQAPDGNHYLRFFEPTAVTDGASFGMGIVEETFADVRVGALVNVTDEAPDNYQGLAARATYAFTPPGGVIPNAYILHVNWEDGPANLSIDIEKVVQIQNIMREDIGAMIPGHAHRKSYYAVLDVIGTDPAFVTGCLYEYKGGPLVARTDTMVDTSGNDYWEDPDALDAPFPAGDSAIFAQNENPEPVGFDVTFDDISSTNAPAAAALLPLDGAQGVPVATTLNWITSAAATSADLYLGTEGAMSKVLSQTTANQYAPPILLAGQTYNWRVDQNTPQGIVTGFTWSFTTKDSTIVDDFESYTDDNLWQAWDPNLPGASVPDPNGLNYLDTDTVQQGANAMRIEYSNQFAPYQREFTSTFATPQDWTVDGIKALTIAFQGQTENTEQSLYITLQDNNGVAASVPIGDSCSVQVNNFNDAYLDLDDFAAQNLDLTAISKITIGLGDGTPSAQPIGDIDTIYIDNIRLNQPKCYNSTGLNLAGDVNNDCAINLTDFALMAQGWLNNGTSNVP